MYNSNDENINNGNNIYQTNNSNNGINNSSNFNQNTNYSNNSYNYGSNQFQNNQNQYREQSNNFNDNDETQKLSRGFRNLKGVFIVFAVIFLIAMIAYLVEAFTFSSNDTSAYYSTSLTKQQFQREFIFLFAACRCLIYAILFIFGAINAKKEKEIAITLGIVTAILEMLSILAFDILDLIIGICILIDCINLKKLYNKVHRIPQ